MQGQRFRYSIRSLMIAVAACAILLVPIGWMARRNALLETWRMRAEVDRMRAIALAERARAEFLAARTASRATRTDTILEPDKSLSGAGPGLWAALAVNHAVFRPEEMKDLNVEFTLIND